LLHAPGNQGARQTTAGAVDEEVDGVLLSPESGFDRVALGLIRQVSGDDLCLDVVPCLERCRHLG